MRRPHAGERIRVQSRIEDGRQGDGVILQANHADEEVIIRYDAHRITYERGTVRRGSIAYPAIALVDTPSWFFEGGDTDSFYYDELEWNSSDGGEGIWFVR